MKNQLLLLFSLFSVLAVAQPGIIKESLLLKSPIMGKDVKYSIFLPGDYDHSTRRYPVLYLLHGFTDDETAWTQKGEAHLIANKMMESGEAPPMIIVMPDADSTWYVNSADGKTRYEDFFVKELIPHIDKTYRSRANRLFRAVAGLSMGGYGTMILATKHPDLFVAAAPLSAAVLTDEAIINMPDQFWENVFSYPFSKDAKGTDRISPHYLSNSILHIIATGNVEELKKVRYFIDCGDDDFLIKGNMELHSAMIDRQVPHEFRVRDGAHDWVYWRASLEEVLKFVGDSFHR